MPRGEFIKPSEDHSGDGAVIVYPEFADLLRTFVEHRDIWVRPAKRNAERVLRALDAFGAPTWKVTLEDFSQPGLVFRTGVPPIRIDVISATSSSASTTPSPKPCGKR